MQSACELRRRASEWKCSRCAVGTGRDSQWFPDNSHHQQSGASKAPGFAL